MYSYRRLNVIPQETEELHPGVPKPAGILTLWVVKVTQLSATIVLNMKT